MFLFTGGGKWPPMLTLTHPVQSYNEQYTGFNRYPYFFPSYWTIVALICTKYLGLHPDLNALDRIVIGPYWKETLAKFHASEFQMDIFPKKTFGNNLEIQISISL